MTEIPSTSDFQDGLSCQFCWRGSEAEDIAGKLHAERPEASSKLVVAHHKCLQYASGLTQYKSSLFGGFDIHEVEKEINRGTKLKCAICKSEKGKGKRATGAVCGCAVKSCRKTFHFVCAYLSDVSITKRLVVTQTKQNKKYVLYRVFCSAAHAASFRECLKEELRQQKKKFGENSTEEEGSPDDSVPVTPGTKSLGASGSFDSSFVSISSPSVDCPAAKSELCSVQSIASVSPSSPVEKELPTEPESLLMKENGIPDQEESDPTVSSSSLAGSAHKTKDKRTSGFFHGNSRRSKIRASQSPQCSPVQEETNENSQSPKVGHSKSSSLIQMDVSVMLENLKCFQVTADNHANMEVSPELSEKTDCGTVSVGEARSPRRPLRGSQNKNLELTCDDIQRTTEQANSVTDVQQFGQTNNIQCTSPVRSNYPVSPVRGRKPSPTKAFSGSATVGNSTDDQENGQLPTSQRNGVSLRSGSGHLSPSLAPENISPGSSPVKERNKNGLRCNMQKEPEISLQLQESSNDESCVVEDMEVTGEEAHSPHISVALEKMLDGSDLENQNIYDEVRSKKKNRLPLSGAKRGRRRKTFPEKSATCRSLSSPSSTGQEHKRSALETEESCVSQGAGEKGKRKFHQMTAADEDGQVEIAEKAARSSGDEDTHQECVLLLLPPDTHTSDVENIRKIAADSVCLKTEDVWSWQHPLSSSLITSDGYIFFVLDVIKAVESGDGSLLQALLFDQERLAERAETYKQQMLVIKQMGDARTEKEMQEALWNCVHRKVEMMSPSPANKWQAAHLFHFNSSTSLALDVRVCDQTRSIRARISAHKGLYRWTETTVADAFPTLNMESRIQSGYTESMILSVWFNEVCHVGEVLVFPQDPQLLDETAADSGSSSTLSTLIETLQDNSGNSDSSENTEQNQSQQQQAPVLFVFRPIDFEVVNFSQYFQKSLRRFLQSRQEVSTVLALIPISNLHAVTGEVVSAVVGRLDGLSDVTHEIFSAFCPTTEPVSLIVVKLTSSSGQNGNNETKVWNKELLSLRKRHGRHSKGRQSTSQ